MYRKIILITLLLSSFSPFIFSQANTPPRPAANYRITRFGNVSNKTSNANYTIKTYSKQGPDISASLTPVNVAYPEITDAGGTSIRRLNGGTFSFNEKLTRNGRTSPYMEGELFVEFPSTDLSISYAMFVKKPIQLRIAVNDWSTSRVGCTGPSGPTTCPAWRIGDTYNVNGEFVFVSGSTNLSYVRFTAPVVDAIHRNYSVEYIIYLEGNVKQ